MIEHSVLIVEDTGSQAETYRAYLEGEEDIEVMVASTGKEAIEKLTLRQPDLMLLDLKLPDMDGLEILRRARAKRLVDHIVVITANASMTTAVEAMREGADDFLVKPFEKERLCVTVRNLLEKTDLRQQVRHYSEHMDRDHFAGFVGSSPAMQAVYRMIEAAAPSRATVFITGESGTGKEVCARAVHDQSPRGAGPFVALNCGAIPKDLIESEVFGHVKGAFTGASSDREGAAARANGGTLFLDEICELDLDLQVKLLRFLQTGTFTRVGGDREETVDIRIVCATNRDPLTEVQQGRFREDLYYRLHVISIHMPPLRIRGDDVVELADYFLKAQCIQESKAPMHFSPESQNVFLHYNWPGNVRQLLNIIQNVVVLSEDCEEITPDILPPPLDQVPTDIKPSHPMRRKSDFLPDGRGSGPAPDRVVVSENAPAGVQAVPTSPQAVRPLAEVERQAIEAAIRVCDGNIPKAAALLEINPSTIYRKKSAWEKSDQAEVQQAAGQSTG